ncbi:putative reverse transcriptase domain, ribonuclease H-like domain protein [Tanacetum coccineum]
MEKLILALVYATRRLRRYFQAHTVTVLTNSPIIQAITKPEKSGRVAKWAIELGEHDIVFQERGDDKKETPKDFLIEAPLEDDRKEAEGRTYTKSENTKLSYLKGKEYTYALRFGFETKNNEAELSVVGKSNKGYLRSQATNDQRIPAEDKREVPVKVLSKRSIEEKEILQVETNEEESWMTPIHGYLATLNGGQNYEARILLVSNEARPAKVIKDYKKCKEQSAIRKAVENGAITTGNGWSFSH